jgi:hypothetical protein
MPKFNFFCTLKGTQELEFFGSDFEISTISLLDMLKVWAIIGGGTIIPLSLKTKGNKQIFQARPI